MTTHDTQQPTPDQEAQPIQPRYTGRRDGVVGEHYRHVNRLAVTSLVLGVLSIATMFSWLAGALPLAGIILAVVALRQINWAPGEMTGRGFAVAGLAMSIGFWVLGTGLYPSCGYQRSPDRLHRRDVRRVAARPQ